jgi:hypothetical protein
MKRLSLLLALIAAVAIGSASGPRPASADTTTPSTYVDATGDSKSAPDVARVTLTPGEGTVAFDIAYTGALGDDGDLVTLIDADRNQQTGSHGFDYLVIATGSSVDFGKWDGTQWTDFPHQPTSPNLTSTDLTFTITLADVGGVATFDFVGGGIRGNDTDAVPDSTLATYPAPVTAPPPVSTAPTVKSILLPGAVFTIKAGKVLRVPRLQVMLTDGTIATVEGQMCTLKAKGKKLPSLAGGCAWKIPKALKKARLILTITFVYGGKTVSTNWPVFPG